jgi:hypothetical protein
VIYKCQYTFRFIHHNFTVWPFFLFSVSLFVRPCTMDKPIICSKCLLWLMSSSNPEICTNRRWSFLIFKSNKTWEFYKIEVWFLFRPLTKWTLKKLMVMFRCLLILNVFIFYNLIILNWIRIWKQQSLNIIQCFSLDILRSFLSAVAFNFHRF